jgi:hypothetical protein
MDAKTEAAATQPKPKPTPLSPPSHAEATVHHPSEAKSPLRSPGSLLKSPSAFEQKPLRMPKPMSI